MSRKRLIIGQTWLSNNGYYALILKKKRPNWILLEVSKMDYNTNQMIKISKSWQSRNEFLLDFPVFVK